MKNNYIYPIVLDVFLTKNINIIIFFFLFSGSPLGYNLAVNTALHAGGLSAGRPGMQPSPRGPGLTGQAGNCQPGYPPRPSEVTNIRYVFSLNIILKLRL